MANYGGAEGFQPGAAVNPSTQVEISVSCRNLKDTDVFSKSDPMVVLFQKDSSSDKFYEIGRTEMISNCLNPDFVKKFLINYFFEESQKLKFQVYDIDSSSQRLDQHDFLGEAYISLGQLVNSTSETITLKGKGIKTGTIILRAEEVSSSKEIVTFHFKANGLDKKDFLGKSDPYLVFSRCNEDRSYTVVHKTEVIKKNLNPTWKPFQVAVRSLCNGDYDRSIKIECYDWDRDGGHDFIGECQTNMRELSRGPSGHNTRDLINMKKKAKKRSYKNSGVLTMLQCKIELQHSFLDYIRGGMEMNFTVAIDFTASNGNPSQATSLHYISPYQPNQYSMAIQAVGEIIQDYDTDKLFPVLGFGARLPPDGRVSHEFFVNGHDSNPYCQGVSGVLEAYQRCISSIQLYGPTNFAPCINHVARFASEYRDGSHYFVLLIITDGIISDMPQTQQAIVQASSLPMSIIIVGVGKADFSAMNILDGDDVRISSNGVFAQRDIVQFVPFREFFSERAAVNNQALQARLAKEVLAEIPDQVLGYMKTHSIKPASRS